MRRTKGVSSKKNSKPSTVDEARLMAYALIDLDYAVAKMGSEKTVQEILGVMLHEELPRDQIALRLAYEKKQWNELERLAHRIKGGAMYCGTLRLLHICQDIERYQQAGAVVLFDQLYHQLVQVMTDTASEIELYLARAAGSHPSPESGKRS